MQAVSLHWEPIHQSQLANTVWDVLRKDGDKTAKLDGSAMDLNQLSQLFTKESKPRSAGKKKAASEKKKTSSLAQEPILPLRRANNIAIGLKRVPKTVGALRDLILAADAEGMGEAAIESLLSIIPTEDEARLVSSRLAAPDMSEIVASFDRDQGFPGLGTADNYVAVVGSIRFLERKLRTMFHMQHFEERARAIAGLLAGVTAACKQMMDSALFREYLAVVLQVGNALHTIGGGQGRRKLAHGFRLADLLKLKDARAVTDKSMTLFDFVIEHIATSAGIAALDFGKEMPEVMKAAKMRVSFRTVEGDLTQLSEELAAVAGEASDDGPDFNVFAAEPVAAEDVDRQASRLAAVAGFSSSVQAAMSRLRDDLAEAKQQFAALSGHFGEGEVKEEEAAAAPSNVFCVVLNLHSDIEAAVKARQKREEEQRRSSARASAASNRRSATPTSTSAADATGESAAPGRRDRSLGDSQPPPLEEEPDEDAMVLLAFYREFKPAKASPRYVRRVLSSYRDKDKENIGQQSSGAGSEERLSGERPDSDGWREAMFEEIGKKEGVDPREHWKELTPRKAAQAKATTAEAARGGKNRDIGQRLAEEAAEAAVKRWGASLQLDTSLDKEEQQGFASPLPNQLRDCDSSSPQASTNPDGDEDVTVRILESFYSKHEPEFANTVKIKKIMRAYRRKAEKKGQQEQWRELMFGAIAEQRGEDPREHWRQQTASANDQRDDAQPVAPLAKDPRLVRLRPARKPRTRGRANRRQPRTLARDPGGGAETDEMWALAMAPDPPASACLDMLAPDSEEEDFASSMYADDATKGGEQPVTSGRVSTFKFPTATSAEAVTLTVQQLQDAQTSLEGSRMSRMVGGEVWEAALLLGTYLCGEGADRVRGRRICELGAGVGLPGLAALGMGAEEVVLSDFPPAVLENLRGNAHRNPAADGREARVVQLDWRDSLAETSEPQELPCDCDLVLGAALVYGAHHAAPLAACIASLLGATRPLEQAERSCVLVQMPTRPGFARWEREMDRFELSVSRRPFPSTTFEVASAAFPGLITSPMEDFEIIEVVRCGDAIPLEEAAV